MKRCLMMLVLLMSSSVVLAQTEDGNGQKPPGNKSQAMPMPDRHVDGVVEQGTQASFDSRGGKVQDAQPERAMCERSLRNWFMRRCRSDSQ